MPVNPEVRKRQEQVQLHLNPDGVQFLKQHRLQLILSTEFIAPKDRPWIDATDDVIQINDGDGSTMLRGRVTIENLINGFAEYKKILEEPLSSITYHLPENEIMEVKFGNVDWYSMLLSLDRLVPSAIIWPQKK